MNFISTLALVAFDKVSGWWSRQSERTQSAVCAGVLLILFIIAGIIEGTAPHGMNY